MNGARETHVVVVGAGPAGLIAAQVAVDGGARVTVFDAERSAGRKFLVAGKGGLNLTHSEPLETFVTRYREAAPKLRPFLEAFPPARLREFADGLGQTTFVGTSGRVFPRDQKAAPLLRTWIARLRAAGVEFRMRQRFHGLLAAEPRPGIRFADESTVTADAIVLAFGGGSWPETGSDGGWVPSLRSAGIDVRDLAPSNAGFETKLPEGLEGKVLKNVELRFGDETARGDLTVTRYGVEGTPAYRLSPLVRNAVSSGAPVTVFVDLKPEWTPVSIASRLQASRGSKSYSSWLRATLRLEDETRVLLHALTKAEFLDPAIVATRLKAFPLVVTGLRPLPEAISSAGGVKWSELDERLMLRRRPGIFIAGEMIDWEAPTGGYLLQACFATGHAAGGFALSWARERVSSPAND